MKDAITYAHDAGFLSFNVIGWKAEFERLVASIRAEYEAPLKLAEEALDELYGELSADSLRDGPRCLMLTQAEEAMAAIRIARQSELASEALTEQHPFADTGKPIDHFADTGKMVAEPVKQESKTIGNALRQSGLDVYDRPGDLAFTVAVTKFAALIQPAKQGPVSVESAEKMGATGAEPTESERQLFEAWMKGHCWAVSGVFDGKTYVDSAETGGYINPHTMHTRCLWAAWRDRAALAAQVQPVQEPVARVDANDEGYWADILPDRSVKVGQLLYAAPVGAKDIMGLK